MQRSEVIHASAWQIKVREMRFLTLTMIDVVVVGIECDEERERESEKVAISRKAQNFSILIFSREGERRTEFDKSSKVLP